MLHNDSENNIVTFFMQKILNTEFVWNNLCWWNIRVLHKVFFQLFIICGLINGHYGIFSSGDQEDYIVQKCFSITVYKCHELNLKMQSTRFFSASEEDIGWSLVQHHNSRMKISFSKELVEKLQNLALTAITALILNYR